MAKETQTYTIEDTIALLQEKAKSLPLGDNFHVKIQRKVGNGSVILAGTPIHVATLAGATVVHIANPEQWLPRLVGGGLFSLTAFPGHEPTLAIGGPILLNLKDEPPHEIDFDAVGRADWQGPPELVFPPRPSARPQQPLTMISSASSIPQQASLPPSQSQGAGGSSSLWGATAGSGVAANGALAQSQVDYQIQRERDFAEREARLREEASKREADLKMERLRLEFDLQQQKFRAEMDAREATARAAEATRAAQNPPARPGEFIAQLMPALAPIVQLFLSSQEASRQATARQQEQAQAQMNLLMTTLTSRPAIDPTVLALLERRGDDGSAQMLHSVADAMASMSRTSVEVLTAALEANGGQQQPAWLMAMEQVGKAIEAIASRGAPQPAGQPQPQYPAPRPQQLPPAGATVPNGTAQVPVPPASNQGGGQAGQNGQRNFNSTADALEWMIRNHYEIEYTSTWALEHAGDPDFQADIQRAGGNVMKLLQDRLGAWLLRDSNQQYASTLFALIKTKSDGILAARQAAQGGQPQVQQVPPAQATVEYVEEEDTEAEYSEEDPTESGADPSVANEASA